MKAELLAFFSKRWVRVTTKVTLALLGVVAATVFFGLVLPLLFIGFGILPHMGAAGIIYIYGGAALGFLLGASSFSVSLVRSDRLVSHFYAYSMAVMLVVSVFFAMISMHTDIFAHI